MRQLLWALAGLLYATGVQAAVTVTVTVTWQANTEADLNGYAVQYASTCDGPWAELATTGTPDAETATLWAVTMELAAAASSPGGLMLMGVGR